MRFLSTVLMQDAFGRRSTRRFEQEAISFVTALADMAALVVDLEALSDSEVLRTAVSQVVEVSDTVTALANKDEGLTLQFDLGAGKSAAHKVISPDKSIFDENGNADLTDTKVSDYVANFTSGAFLISDGEVVLGVNKGTLDV